MPLSDVINVHGQRGATALEMKINNLSNSYNFDEYPQWLVLTIGVYIRPTKYSR